MINYMIYSSFLLLCVFLLVLSVFSDFEFISPNTLEDVLRPCG